VASRGAQYRTSCMLCGSRLIWCCYKMMLMRDRGPYLILYSQGGRATSRFRKESTSCTLLGVLHMDPDMPNFITEY
jgi:hypothetical protein